MGWRTWMEERRGETGAEGRIYEKGSPKNEIWQAAALQTGQARTSNSAARKQTVQTALFNYQLGPCIQTAKNKNIRYAAMQ